MLKGAGSKTPFSTERGYNRAVVMVHPRLDESSLAALRALADEYRSSCLWFLRADYYPSTADEWLRLLDQIERHGDREAFRKAATARQWLSRISSAESVVS